MNDQPIIIERTFKAPTAKIWQALTDRDEMKKWYFDLTEFKPEVGFKFEFTGGPEDGIQYLHLCEITEMVPQQKLKHNWRYDGYAGNSFVTWELFDHGDSTLVRLTHDKLETFPQENKDLHKQNFVEGWTHIVNTSLKEYVEG